MYVIGDNATINDRVFRIKNPVFRPVEHFCYRLDAPNSPETLTRFLSYNTDTHPCHSTSVSQSD
jgi:hypothetical protein